MKVLYVEPLKKPRVIDTSLRALDIYELLNTDIYERCWFFEDDVCLLCDEIGWYHDYQMLNRHIRNAVIKGPFILCCEEDYEYKGLKDEYIIKYMEMFEKPEYFMIIGKDVFYFYVEDSDGFI